MRECTWLRNYGGVVYQSWGRPVEELKEWAVNIDKKQQQLLAIYMESYFHP